MSFPAAPSKTPAGVEELRLRSLGLSQRHRTVLLLVDGRRPLGELLGMALKAGAATTHFEDLVRLGLVEVPVEAMAPEPQFTAPAPLDEPRMTSVEVTVDASPSPFEDDAAAELPAEAASARQASATATARTQPVDRMAAPAAAMPVPAPAATASSPALAPAQPPGLRPSIPAQPPATAPGPATAPAGPTAAAPPLLAAPEVIRARVRALLLTFVAAENSLVGSLMLTRIRTAHTQQDLIGLVWELERQRPSSRNGHARIRSLQEARDLLGMGNTLVAGDSQQGGEWPDTHGR